MRSFTTRSALRNSGPGVPSSSVHQHLDVLASFIADGCAEGDLDLLFRRRGAADDSLTSGDGAKLDARDDGPTLGDTDERAFLTLAGTAEASAFRLFPDVEEEGVASRATTVTAPPCAGLETAGVRFATTRVVTVVPLPAGFVVFDFEKKLKSAPGADIVEAGVVVVGEKGQ